MTSENFGFLAASNAQFGEESDGIEGVQTYLERFGYMQGELVGEVTMRNFDTGTRQALQSYQRFHGLPITGEMDDATLTEMVMPRCGITDIPGPERFTLGQTKWNRTNLTYSFTSFSSDLDRGLQREAVRKAFGLWSNACGLTFTEVSGNPDIRIGFGQGDHGDGFSFDGPGNVLGHAFPPPPAGGDIAGDAHFDESEAWDATLPIGVGKIDLVTVFAHEFGHSIGLKHSEVRGALMFPTYRGPQRFLHADDIAGAQALYGHSLTS